MSWRVFPMFSPRSFNIIGFESQLPSIWFLLTHLVSSLKCFLLQLFSCPWCGSGGRMSDWMVKSEKSSSAEASPRDMFLYLDQVCNYPACSGSFLLKSSRTPGMLFTVLSPCALHGPFLLVFRGLGEMQGRIWLPALCSWEAALDSLPFPLQTGFKAHPPKFPHSDICLSPRAGSVMITCWLVFPSEESPQGWVLLPSSSWLQFYTLPWLYRWYSQRYFTLFWLVSLILFSIKLNM